MAAEDMGGGTGKKARRKNSRFKNYTGGNISKAETRRFQKAGRTGVHGQLTGGRKGALAGGKVQAMASRPKPAPTSTVVADRQALRNQILNDFLTTGLVGDPLSNLFSYGGRMM